MARDTQSLKLLDPRAERRELRGLQVALVFAALLLAALAVRPSIALHHALETRGIDPR